MQNYKVLIASNPFKGSATSMEVANAIAKGLSSVAPTITIEKIAVSDGGDGFLEAFPKEQMKYIPIKVQDAIGNTIDATLGIYKGNTAIIEMAQASGIIQISKKERNPLVASSFGTGQMICHALSMKLPHIFVGIGGTATNDGGAGIAQALGVKLFDAAGKELPKGAEALNSLHTINLLGLHKQLKETSITVFSDVTNQLCGSKGATYTYAQQKGARKKDLPILDKALYSWGTIIENLSNKKLINRRGVGAGGGASLPLMAWGNTTICNGAEQIIKECSLDKKIAKADLVITGEGKLDSQSSQGKFPFKIASIARKYNTKCIAVVGSKSLDLPLDTTQLFSKIYPLVNEDTSLQKALKNTQSLLTSIAQRIAMEDCNTLYKRDF